MLIKDAKIVLHNFHPAYNAYKKGSKYGDTLVNSIYQQKKFEWNNIIILFLMLYMLKVVIFDAFDF
jgi:hypothetical protein